jgi:hypothetical protein
VDRHHVADDRRITVRDVAERTGVHDGRRILKGLHEVRLERVAQQHGHRARAFELSGRYRLTFLGVAHNDALETRT